MLYVVTCNGSLVLKSGPVATGGEVEMSEAEALSLPLGTVSRVERKAVVLLPPPPPAAPFPSPPVVEAPRSRRNKS